MTDQKHSLPLRWWLPLAQLAICALLLFPVRGRLLFGIEQATHSYVPTPEKREQFIIDLPALTPEQQRELDAERDREEMYIRAPLVLNFPVVIAQLPYILASPAKREWIPEGMFPEVWRALSWPLAGVLFWWWMGRAFEALNATRGGVLQPRLGWIDTGFAAILVLLGVVSFIGIVTSTFDDRKDIQFMALMAGGLFWGALAEVVILTRIRQRRIVKTSTTTAPSATPNPA